MQNMFKKTKISIVSQLFIGIVTFVTPVHRLAKLVKILPLVPNASMVIMKTMVAHVYKIAEMAKDFSLPAMTEILMMKIPIVVSFPCKRIVRIEMFYINFADCGHTQPSNARITRGSNADPHEYPWQVSFVNKFNTTDNVCGGTIMSKIWIMTAAHCDISREDHYVVLGAHNISDQSMRIVREVSL